MELPKETLVLPYSNKHYCPYCGKQIQGRNELDGWKENTIYECDCADFIKAHEVIQQIEQLMFQIPSHKFHIGPAVIKWQTT